MATRIRPKIEKSIEATLIIGYSVFVLLARSPLLGEVSNYLIITYYVFIPGYALTSLLAEEYDVLSRLFYSVLIGLALLLSLSGLEQDNLLLIPTNYTLTIPMIIIVVEAYVFYFRMPSKQFGQRNGVRTTIT